MWDWLSNWRIDLIACTISKSFVKNVTEGSSKPDFDRRMFEALVLWVLALEHFNRNIEKFDFLPEQISFASLEAK